MTADDRRARWAEVLPVKPLYFRNVLVEAAIKLADEEIASALDAEVTHCLECGFPSSACPYHGTVS